MRGASRTGRWPVQQELRAVVRIHLEILSELALSEMPVDELRRGNSSVWPRNSGHETPELIEVLLRIDAKRWGAR